jgi:hypothetical protein
MRSNKEKESEARFQENGIRSEHFQAKHALGLDPRVDTGSPSENAIKQIEKERET